MTAPPQSCCHASEEGCVCAAQARCSCGKEQALHCNCTKAETENDMSGPRCSCSRLMFWPFSSFSCLISGPLPLILYLYLPPLSLSLRAATARRGGCFLACWKINLTRALVARLIGSRPAGQCTCERAMSENHPISGDACPCGKRGAGTFHLLSSTRHGSIYLTPPLSACEHGRQANF